MTFKTALLAPVLTLAAASLAVLAAVPETAQAQNRRNWGTAVSETAGGHLLGNPQAATKVTVFISYSCSHCAAFEMQSDAPLRTAYIQPGRVSLEVRPYLRNVLDIAATLAVECGPENRFWANHRAMLRGQGRWLDVASNASPAQQQRWSNGPLPQRLRAVASDLGFYQLMQGRGYSRAQLDVCLNDEAAASALAARSQADGTRYNIPGTPAIVINGNLEDGAHDWATVRQRIDLAIGLASGR